MPKATAASIRARVAPVHRPPPRRPATPNRRSTHGPLLSFMALSSVVKAFSPRDRSRAQDMEPGTIGNTRRLLGWTPPRHIERAAVIACPLSCCVVVCNFRNGRFLLACRNSRLMLARQALAGLAPRHTVPELAATIIAGLPPVNTVYRITGTRSASRRRENKPPMPCRPGRHAPRLSSTPSTPSSGAAFVASGRGAGPAASTCTATRSEPRAQLPKPRHALTR